MDSWLGGQSCLITYPLSLLSPEYLRLDPRSSPDKDFVIPAPAGIEVSQPRNTRNTRKRMPHHREHRVHRGAKQIINSQSSIINAKVSPQSTQSPQRNHPSSIILNPCKGPQRTSEAGAELRNLSQNGIKLPRYSLDNNVADVWCLPEDQGAAGAENAAGR